jgi:formylglycine-generating enzyme required for sulfatase activity
MQFAWVPPGESWLGGGGSKPGTKKVLLKQRLWCGVCPVTQAEWQTVMGDNPSHFKGNPHFPVESVSYQAAEKFIQKLNQQSATDGLLYRLPTEDEWEYICRGGPLSHDQSKYHFYFARSKTDLTPVPTNDLSSDQANFNNTLGRPCDVGLYLPNSLGIYDLHGNVWEWTSSKRFWLGRVIRGGSWVPGAAYCSASIRDFDDPAYAHYDLGFRLLAVPSGK